MATTITKIEVFVSSPSDLVDERGIITEVCEEVSRDRGRRDGFVLEPIKWETHSRPSVGKDPQAVISQQIGDDYDIYIGILGSRFGTPTLKAGSGTEDEFESAIARHEAGESIEIMFYFRDPKSAPGNISAEQLLKVENFKKSIPTKGVLYHDYQEVDEFKNVVSRHLSSAVSDVLGNKDSSSLSTDVKIIDVVEVTEEVDPLSNLRAAMSQNEDGMMDLVEQASDEIDLFSLDTDELTFAVSDLGNKFNDSTAAINDMAKNGQSPRVNPKRIMGVVSRNMETYTKRVAEILPNLHDHLGNGLDLMGRAINISLEDTSVSSSDKEELSETLTELRQAIHEASNKLGGFQESVTEFPRMTSSMNRAKRRVIAVNNDLLAFFDRSITQLDEMSSALWRE